MAKTSERKQGIFTSRDGKRTVDVTKAPKWWPSTAEESEQVLRSLPGVRVFEIGRSAGGHPIIAGAWGKREELPNRTCRSLSSAIAGGSSAAFYGEGERIRQSFVFVGNAHGLELDGTVAALNMLSVVTTGKDLRGREWPRLHRYGRKLRIVVIPHLNMDARMRYPWYRHSLDINHDDARRIFFGDWEDGRGVEWEESKRYSPIPQDRISPLGVYFNDNGINLLYDTVPGIDPQPETKALFSFLREEMPDCALFSHTNEGSCIVCPDPFVPARYRQRQEQIGALVGARCKYEGAKIGPIIEGYGVEIFRHSAAAYHACGALPLMTEFPAFFAGSPTPPTFAEILDIGLYVLEEVLAFGVTYRFRPRE